MFIQIPPYAVLDFTFAKFVAHVVDQSPAYGTRSMLRLGLQAIDAVEAASDGYAELGDDACVLLQLAAESTPLPRLAVQIAGGEPQPVPVRAYVPFFEAIEQATAVRPVAERPVAERPVVEAEAVAAE